MRGYGLILGLPFALMVGACRESPSTPTAKEAHLSAPKPTSHPEQSSTVGKEGGAGAIASVDSTSEEPEEPEEPEEIRIELELDTKWEDVARLYGTTVEELNQLNGLEFDANTLLKAGSELYVPPRRPEI